MISATRSPRELPTAKTVRPRMASLMFRIVPRALRRPTTSPARVEIQAMETRKPR